MITFSASCDDKENYHVWSQISEVVLKNLTPEMRQQWALHGYEGIFDLVSPYFDMNRMYRNNRGFVAFEFTEEQWTWFVLRWL